MTVYGDLAASVSAGNDAVVYTGGTIALWQNVSAGHDLTLTAWGQDFGTVSAGNRATVSRTFLVRR